MPLAMESSRPVRSLKRNVFERDAPGRRFDSQIRQNVSQNSFSITASQKAAVPTSFERCVNQDMA
jgi:hypothetical protein